MSTPPTSQRTSPRDEIAPRVRHQARDAATLMAFSMATSSAVALLLLAVAHAGR